MIELNVLEKMYHADLRSVGITRLVQRNKILKEIAKFKPYDTVKNLISGPTFSEFSCNFCDQNFPTLDLLDVHMPSHDAIVVEQNWNSHYSNLPDDIQMHNEYDELGTSSREQTT